MDGKKDKARSVPDRRFLVPTQAGEARINLAESTRNRPLPVSGVGAIAYGGVAHDSSPLRGEEISLTEGHTAIALGASAWGRRLSQGPGVSENSRLGERRGALKTQPDRVATRLGTSPVPRLRLEPFTMAFPTSTSMS